MMARLYDIIKEMFRGNIFRLPIRMKQSDGRPVELTGATVIFVLGPYDQSTAGVTITIYPDTGLIDITVSRELISALDYDYYEFKVEVNEDTILFGRLDLRRSEIQ